MCVVLRCSQPEGFVRRIEDTDDKDNGNRVPSQAASLVEPAAKKPKLAEKPAASFGLKSRGVNFAVKAKKPSTVATSSNGTGASKGKAQVVVAADGNSDSDGDGGGGLGGLLGAYGSDGSSGGGSP